MASLRGRLGASGRAGRAITAPPSFENRSEDRPHNVCGGESVRRRRPKHCPESVASDQSGEVGYWLTANILSNQVTHKRDFPKAGVSIHLVPPPER